MVWNNADRQGFVHKAMKIIITAPIVTLGRFMVTSLGSLQNQNRDRGLYTTSNSVNCLFTWGCSLS